MMISLRTWKIGLLLMLCAAPAAHAEYDAQRVEFGSYTVEDYRPILAREFKVVPVQIEGWLALPKTASASTKVPAVVIMPGSSGITGQAYEFTLARNPESVAAALRDRTLKDTVSFFRGAFFGQ